MLPVICGLAILCGTTLVCVAPLTRFAPMLETVGIVLFIVGLATIGASLARVFR